MTKVEEAAGKSRAISCPGDSIPDIRAVKMDRVVYRPVLSSEPVIP